MKVYYAGKAFLSTEVARWMTDAGLNIDVCSGGELAVALAAGVDPARLGLHGNNKSHAEIDRCVELGVGAIVLDSVVEVDRVAEAARPARHGCSPCGCASTAGCTPRTHEYLATAREDQKFGIPLADAPDVVAQIRAHDSLRFLGLALAHRIADLRVRRVRRGGAPAARSCTPGCWPAATCPSSTSAAGSASRTRAPTW